MYYVYVLQSIDKKHFYIGATSNLDKRLIRHNGGSTKSTKPYRPWEIVYKEKYQTREGVMKREYYLKSPKGYKEKREIFAQINKHGEVA